MYVIIVYDVGVERVNKVKSFLRMFLTWIQNSVFEGELTISQLELVRNGLKKIINQEKDSVIIYSLRTQKELSKEIIGKSKTLFDRVI